ncbi:unnamed protein product [Blepharisma stoltei]|uniref:Uncharacterized protein n=1 Tax=Blepharisma stoltei TaxID=1481888 RepID=A0AAU9JE93_9CILI|nr:unnamed protein product [Blepharisma stoltei]
MYCSDRCFNLAEILCDNQISSTSCSNKFDHICVDHLADHISASNKIYYCVEPNYRKPNYSKESIINKLKILKQTKIKCMEEAQKEIANVMEILKQNLTCLNYMINLYEKDMREINKLRIKHYEYENNIKSDYFRWFDSKSRNLFKTLRLDNMEALEFHIKTPSKSHSIKSCQLPNNQMFCIGIVGARYQGFILDESNNVIEITPKVLFLFDTNLVYLDQSVYQLGIQGGWRNRHRCKSKKYSLKSKKWQNVAQKVIPLKEGGDWCCAAFVNKILMLDLSHNSKAIMLYDPIPNTYSEIPFSVITAFKFIFVAKQRAYIVLPMDYIFESYLNDPYHWNPIIERSDFCQFQRSKCFDYGINECYAFILYADDIYCFDWKKKDNIKLMNFT